MEFFDYVFDFDSYHWIGWGVTRNIVFEFIFCFVLHGMVAPPDVGDFAYCKFFFLFNYFNEDWMPAAFWALF